MPEGWQEQVSARDADYINELLRDLRARGDGEADQVFEQLGQLSVGPLVTERVVSIDLQSQAVEYLYPGFRPYR